MGKRLTMLKACPGFKLQLTAIVQCVPSFVPVGSIGVEEGSCIKPMTWAFVIVAHADHRYTRFTA